MARSCCSCFIYDSFSRSPILTVCFTNDMDCKGVSVHSSGSNLQKQRLVPVSDMLVTICFSIHRGIYLVSSHPDWEVDWHGTFPTRPTFLHIHQHTLLLAYPTVPLSLNLRNSQVPLCGWCSVMIGQSREIISFRSLLVVWWVSHWWGSIPMLSPSLGNCRDVRMTHSCTVLYLNGRRYVLHFNGGKYFNGR